MLKQGSGKIINISSGQALMGVPLMAHYSAAKGGMISLTRALAAENRSRKICGRQRQGSESNIPLVKYQKPCD